MEHLKCYLPLSRACLVAALAMTSASLTAGETSKGLPEPGITGMAPTQVETTVTGTVSDNYGPLIGATIMEKGTNNGTITDLNGKFSLKVSSTNATLVISSIGFTSKEIKVGSQKTFNILLMENNKSLNEVVVVGYGTQKKVNMTGSVSAINVSELAESRPITNVSQALSGLAAGVNVTSNHNQPGNDNASILVRGQGTLNSSAPLVIVDGTEAGINTVNPQDIESVSILKDDASAVIYG